ncbi:hypothetical protein CDD83_9943 [Cordyceps sp. RAO-2017]|nr:hypothetical protein CDD83_9943 [Cordyceps sp. RAO-2017]
MLNYGCINRVYYAHATLRADGEILLGDEWADIRAPVDGAQGALGSLIHLKQKHPHLQVILSIGGGNSSQIYSIVAANALLRDNFARSASAMVEASGLDGIDVAWAHPSDAKQGCDLLALLAAVRVRLPSDCFILTAALPANKAILQLVDLRRAADYLDFINLIAFDFFGTWTFCSGHHAQLYAMSKSEEASAASGVAYVLSQGFPAKSLLLGVPMYGRSFLLATGPGQLFMGGGGENGMFAYNELPLTGCRETVDKRHVAAQCVGKDGGFVTYDNPDTVRAKAGFCKQKGLGVSQSPSTGHPSRHTTSGTSVDGPPTGPVLLECTG